MFTMNEREEMETRSRAGRIIGSLILVQIVSGILVNFVLAAPLFGEPGFLVNAAAHSTQISLSVLIGAAVGLLSIGIAVTGFPVFRQHSLTLALFYIALAAASFALTVVENMNVMSMLSLSESYAKAGVAQHDLYQGLRIVVASARNWAHFIGLIVSGITLLVLYTTLLRFALVPRVLAAFGLVAVMLQLIAVSMPLFGRDVIFPMLMPLGICQIVLAGWLITKGFRAGALTRHVQKQGAG